MIPNVPLLAAGANDCNLLDDPQSLDVGFIEVLTEATDSIHVQKSFDSHAAEDVARDGRAISQIVV